MRFKAKHFTGTPAQQAYKADLARRIYRYHRYWTWEDSEYYAWLAIRHGLVT